MPTAIFLALHGFVSLRLTLVQVSEGQATALTSWTASDTLSVSVNSYQP